MSKTPVKVAVTGAAGQIGYSLLFRLASGALLGPDTPVELRLLEITPALEGARGRGDGARRLRVPDPRRGRDRRRREHRSSTASTSPCSSAPGPATKGMERGDLLEANGAIFTAQGKALNDSRRRRHPHRRHRQPGQHQRADRDDQRPRHPRGALLRADPPGPQPGDLAARRARPAPPSPTSSKMTIWGNHSATQYPDIFHAEVAGKNAAEVVGDQSWIENDFIPTVAKRGAAIIEARGSSSAASAASATIDAAHDWLTGSTKDDWVSMAVVSDGSYGVPEGLISSFPVTTTGGELGDRPGPGDRRLLAHEDRRQHRRARRGARRGQGARPDLSTARPRNGACPPRGHAPFPRPGHTGPDPSRRGPAHSSSESRRSA